jgi:hypothetical protein
MSLEFHTQNGGSIHNNNLILKEYLFFKIKSAVTHHWDDDKYNSKYSDDDGSFQTVSLTWTPPRNIKINGLKFM